MWTEQEIIAYTIEHDGEQSRPAGGNAVTAARSVGRGGRGAVRMVVAGTWREAWRLRRHPHVKTHARRAECVMRRQRPLGQQRINNTPSKRRQTPPPHRPPAGTLPDTKQPPRRACTNAGGQRSTGMGEQTRRVRHHRRRAIVRAAAANGGARRGGGAGAEAAGGGRRPGQVFVAVCGGTRGPPPMCPAAGGLWAGRAHAAAPRAGARRRITARASACIWGAEALAGRARVLGWVDAAGVVHQSTPQRRPARRRRKHSHPAGRAAGGARACHAGGAAAGPSRRLPTIRRHPPRSTLRRDTHRGEPQERAVRKKVGEWGPSHLRSGLGGGGRDRRPASSTADGYPPATRARVAVTAPLREPHRGAGGGSGWPPRRRPNLPTSQNARSPPAAQSWASSMVAGRRRRPIQTSFHTIAIFKLTTSSDGETPVSAVPPPPRLTRSPIQRLKGGVPGRGNRLGLPPTGFARVREFSRISLADRASMPAQDDG